MLSYKSLKGKPRVFKSLTGMEFEEFEKLLISFDKALETFVEENHINKERKRVYGGGRKPRLRKTEDKLLFILFYYKVYPLQEVLAHFFDMSQSQANEWIHKLSVVLNMSLDIEKSLPERNPNNLESVLDEYIELEFIIDGTERPIQRPKDKDKQKEYYSGKKKSHTVKNNIITDANSRKVIYLSKTYSGKKHDKKICDEECYCFPDNSLLIKDSGFQGYEPSNIKCLQPLKKPRGKELNFFEKLSNCLISSVRIFVEHIISGIKILHIVKDIYRNHKDGFDDLIMETACGLHNFRSSCRSL